MNALSDPRRLPYAPTLDFEQLLQVILARRVLLVRGATVWSDDATAPKRAAA